MHYHAERGNDRVAEAVEDRSSRSAWECRQGRSAFRFWQVAQSVTGCHQSVGAINVINEKCPVPFDTEHFFKSSYRESRNGTCLASFRRFGSRDGLHARP
ncbi:hypothetical protein SAMN03159474_01134 [Pseudomonas sp. NFACC08-1]|nr:hypothetical protein SAMN03159474_01134 [Pseudomonas sp. NFACC08-1]